MARKIYWLGGYQASSAEERARDRYGEKLEKIFHDELGSRSDFQFIQVRRCDAKQFKRIWQDEDTVGIIWHSHGERPGGYPAAISREPWRKRYETLNPIDPAFPMSGTNLKFAAFLTCSSAQLRNEWRRKIRNPKAEIKTFAVNLVEGSEDFMDMTDRWINYRSVRKPESPTMGVKYLFEYASGEWDRRSTGCGCDLAQQAEVGRRRPQLCPQIIGSEAPEEPIRVWVPYRRIPKMGIEAPRYTQHTMRFGDRVWHLAGDYGYGNPQRFVQDVARLNPGIDFKRLRPGQVINVPTKVGVPTQLSAPYALQKAQARHDGTPPVPKVTHSRLEMTAQALRRPSPTPAPSTLDLLQRQLRQTPSPPRPIETDTLSSLRRLEREALDQQQTQRWLDRVQQQLDRRPGAFSTGLGAPSSLDLAKRALMGHR